MKTPLRLLPILLAFAAGWSQDPVARVAEASPASEKVGAGTGTDSAASTSAVPVRDSAKAIQVATPSVGSPDTSATVRDTVRRGPQVPLVVRSGAPIGSHVTFDGRDVSVDSSGRFLASIKTDSLRRATGSFELCLLASNEPLCTPIRPQGFDTLDIAPLQIKIDSVVETHDTVRQIVDTSRYDSSALKSTDGPKVIQSAAGKTVVVRGKRRPPRVLGEERVTVQTIKRLPGLAEPDVIRAVQALPGVVSSSDFSTKIYVRGSSSDENLILFDNAVVYSPAHFGGLFSTFLADATGGLDFYKGGFDPRYGDRLASVLLVSSKVGGTDRDSARDSTSGVRKGLDSGIRGLESAVSRTPSDSEPPVSSQGSVRLTTFSGTVATDGVQGNESWALAGRRTWIGSALAIARDLHATDLQLDYDFYDWQGSAAWGHSGDTVRASIYQGRDKLSFDPFTVDWGNLVVPVNVRWKLGDRLTFFGTASYSKFDQTFDFAPILTFYNAVDNLAGRAELRYDAGFGHLLSAGSEYNDFHVNFTQLVPYASSTLASVTNSDLWSGWLQDRWVIDPRHTVTAGVRGYWYGTLGEAAADPRISYTWRPVQDWKFDAHWGHYTQYLTSLRFADQETPNEFWYADQKPMVSTTLNMTSAGVERTNLGSLNLHASLEGYYKDLHDLPLFYPNNTGSGDQAASSAGYDYFARNFAWLDGYAAGAEFSLGKDDGWWNGNVSYAYSQAVLHQQPYTNSLGTTTPEPYWADWDQRHTFKLSGALNWIGRKSDEALSVRHMNVGDYYRSSFQLTTSSGLPYTQYLGDEHSNEPLGNQVGSNVSGAPSPYPENQTQLIAGPRNGARKPAYFRLDVTPVDWGRTGRWRFYFTIINLTNHQNLYLVNYNTRDNPPSEKRIYQFPILPFFMGYEYQF